MAIVNINMKCGKAASAASAGKNINISYNGGNGVSAKMAKGVAYQHLAWPMKAL
jgi:hypothetical protein